MWGEHENMTEKKAEGLFESSEKLRKFSDELKREKLEWQAYMAKAIQDVEECRVFLKEFRAVVETYKEVLDGFIVEIDNLKEFKQLVELNKQLVDALRR